jgi:hypothetical protein
MVDLVLLGILEQSALSAIAEVQSALKLSRHTAIVVNLEKLWYLHTEYGCTRS